MKKKKKNQGCQPYNRYNKKLEFFYSIYFWPKRKFLAALSEQFKSGSDQLHE